MNSRIIRFGLITVAVAVVVAIGIELRPATNSGAQVTASPKPGTSPDATLGKLAYALDGDIYVADGDGSNPVRIADGRPENFSGWRTYGGPVWSPDGRYLAYLSSSHRGTQHEIVASTIHTTVYISDPEGRLVASFPCYYFGGFTWSPDSERIATWLSQGPYRIGIYGVDGARQTLLTMPRGFRGPDGAPVWVPDGSSLIAPTWGVEVPIDGRRPRQLPVGDSRSQGWVWYSPDGTRVASTRDWAVITGAPLFIAAADGSHARKLVSDRVENAVWSPAGDRIAFDTPNVNVASDWRRSDTRLRVVDVASGTVTTLTDAGSQDRAISFSAGGESIVFSRTRSSGVSSLWSIGADGSNAHRLVAGTFQGGWQPVGRLP